MSSKRKVRVALAGCGVVGSDLVRAIRNNAARVEAEHGVQLELVRVLVRRPERPREVDFAPGVLTGDLDSFLATDADILAEAIGGLDPAERIARSSLARAVPLVTANKALLAVSGDALACLARAHGASLFIEAAVASGVPIVRVVQDYIGRGPITRIRGILNGTCNFVLTQLERGSTFAAAVAEAQRRGFAEADPTRDLDGTDAADKIAVLAWLAFGVPGHALHVEKQGLLPDGERLVRGAAAAGARLRLIAECSARQGRVFASVTPVVVAADSSFGRTVDEENRIAVETGWAWPIELAGPGAGGVPTAAAMFADILQAIETPARSVPAAGSFVSANGDGRAAPCSWLIGVRAGAAREAREGFAAAGVAATPVGATGADAWLAVQSASAEQLDDVLRALGQNGVRPASARIDDPGLVAPVSHRRYAPVRTTIAAGG